MTLDDTKIDVVRSVWNDVQAAASTITTPTKYDDGPGKVRYYVKETKKFTGDRLVIIIEIGYQSSLKDVNKYRRMAWALYQGFDAEILKGETIWATFTLPITSPGSSALTRTSFGR